MAVLHLVNRPAALADCLRMAAEEDAILLLENGVYGGVDGIAPARPVHALAVDVAARGLSDRLGPAVSVVDDAGFVALVERHTPVVTWR
jgi:tRNA 2-thiouridine synthesizing protein B